MKKQPGSSVFVFFGGTWSEPIKLAPVIRAVAARGPCTQIVATGQQPVLFGETLACFELAPDLDLGI